MFAVAEKNEGSKLSSTWRPANDYVNLKVGKLYNIHYNLFTKYSFFRKIYIIVFFRRIDIIDLHSAFTGQLSGERRKSSGFKQIKNMV